MSRTNKTQIIQTLQISTQIKDDKQLNHINNKSTKIVKQNNYKLIDLKRTKASLWKNFIRIKRNPMTLLIFYLLPIIEIVLIVLCTASPPDSLPVAIFNPESEPKISQLFIDQIDRNSIHYKYYDSNESAFNSVVEGKSWFEISFEKNFSESFRTRLLEPNLLTDEELEFTKIKLYSDMTNFFTAVYIHQHLLESFQNFLQNFSAVLGFNPLAFSVPLKIEQPIYGKNEWLFHEYLAAGIILGLIHALPMIFSAFTVVVERNERHLERAFVAGVKPIEILISHIIVVFIAILPQVLLSMLFAFVIFDLPLRGPVLDAFLLLVLQGLQGMSIGLLITFIVPDVVFAVVSNHF
jgi:ABC-2 type transport system permease protein